MNLIVSIIDPLVFSLVLLAFLLLCVPVGRWLGPRLGKPDGDSAASMNGAVFALLGLMLAFTFSGAMSRFEARRGLMLEETNAVGTAYLRIDLLPAENRPALRELFRQYVQARLDTCVDVGSPASLAAYARSLALQGEIWTEALVAIRASGNAAVLSQVTGALNAMFDMATRQAAVVYSHPPPVIYLALFLMACIAALLVGAGLAGKPVPWLQVITFVLTLVITVYIILDLEYPRLGLIRVDAADEMLHSVLRSMKAAPR
jgi:hypothetical protein